MFQETYYPQFYNLATAIELGSKEKVLLYGVPLYDEPNTPLRENGDSALHIAAEFGQLEIFVVIWKQMQASPNVKNVRGENPFHYACKEGALDIVKLYMQDVKMNVDVKADMGWTGIFYAVLNCQVYVVKYLVSKKAHLNSIDKKSRTPLHWAAKYEFVECLKIMVEGGGDLEVVNAEKQTPLQMILAWTNEESASQVNSILKLSKRKIAKKYFKKE